MPPSMRTSLASLVFVCKNVISSILQRDIHNTYQFSLKKKYKLYIKSTYDSKYLPRDVSEDILEEERSWWLIQDVCSQSRLLSLWVSG